MGESKPSHLQMAEIPDSWHSKLSPKKQQWSH